MDNVEIMVKCQNPSCKYHDEEYYGRLSNAKTWARLHVKHTEHTVAVCVTTTVIYDVSREQEQLK